MYLKYLYFDEIKNIPWDPWFLPKTSFLAQIWLMWWFEHFGTYLIMFLVLHHTYWYWIHTQNIDIFWWNRTYVIKSTFLGLCSLHTWPKTCIWHNCGTHDDLSALKRHVSSCFSSSKTHIYSFTYPTCLSYILMKLKIIYSKYTLNIQYLCLSIYPKTGFGPNFAHMMV